MDTTPWNDFRCPVCKADLESSGPRLSCTSCGRVYPFKDGIPDLFIAESETETIKDHDQTWLDPKIVAARDTFYRLCTRQLQGMKFCMAEIANRTQEIADRTGEPLRILEVGAGTGHFTRWLAEASSPGTLVYAFDFSRPILKVARTNTHGLANVRLFRANARGRLPFVNEYFDIVFLRLAPLGARGVPNVQAGFELLQPGGWFFEAGWGRAHAETPPAAWAMDHGFERAETHEWRYWRPTTEAERAAARLELADLAPRLGKTLAEALPPERETVLPDGSKACQNLTSEHLLIARKPG